MTSNVVYKIQRPDGQFSTGSTWPRFAKYGKAWTQKHHLLAHLRLIRKQKLHLTDRYDGCKVVEFHLIPEKAMPVDDFIKIEESQKEKTSIKLMIQES